MKIGKVVDLVMDLLPLAVIAAIGYIAYNAYQSGCFLGIGGACAGAGGGANGGAGGGAGAGAGDLKDVIASPLGVADPCWAAYNPVTSPGNYLLCKLGVLKVPTAGAPAPAPAPVFVKTPAPLPTSQTREAIASVSTTVSRASRTSGSASATAEALIATVASGQATVRKVTPQIGGVSVTISNVKAGTYRETGGRKVPSYVAGGKPVPYTG